MITYQDYMIDRSCDHDITINNKNFKEDIKFKSKSLKNIIL